MNYFVVESEKLNQLPCGHAQMRRRRRRETVTRMSAARTRRCTENSQIPGKRKPNGTGRGFLQGHTRGAITPAPFVQTTSGCRATVPRTPRPGRPPPFSAGPAEREESPVRPRTAILAPDGTLAWRGAEWIGAPPKAPGPELLEPGQWLRPDAAFGVMLLGGGAAGWTIVCA